MGRDGGDIEKAGRTIPAISATGSAREWYCFFVINASIHDMAIYALTGGRRNAL